MEAAVSGPCLCAENYCLVAFGKPDWMSTDLALLSACHTVLTFSIREIPGSTDVCNYGCSTGFQKAELFLPKSSLKCVLAGVNYPGFQQGLSCVQLKRHTGRHRPRCVWRFCLADWLKTSRVARWLVLRVRPSLPKCSLFFAINAQLFYVQQVFQSFVFAQEKWTFLSFFGRSRLEAERPTCESPCRCRTQMVSRPRRW